MAPGNGGKHGGKDLALQQRALAAAAKAKQREEHDSSDSEEEDNTFFQEPSPEKPKASKKKAPKKRKNPSNGEESESDTEPNRTPLSDTCHTNRQEIRKEHQSTMAKKASTSAKRQKVAAKSSKKKGKRKSDASDSEEEQSDCEGMTKKQLEAYRAKCREQAKTIAAGMVASEAMITMVEKCTKRELFKICKFFKNDGFLQKGVNFVMQKLDLTEFEGLSGKELIKKQEIWKALYSPYVQKALNSFRNYVGGEIRNVVYNAFKNNQTDDMPNAEEVYDLALRNKLDSKTDKNVRKDMEAKFVTYWDVLLPKVAGSKYWSPSNRHYMLISTAKSDIFVPEGSDLDDSVECVTASDEAFLAISFANAYKKWVKQADKYKQSVEDNILDPSVPIFDPKKDKEDYGLPYTNAKAGNKKYGGWVTKGIERYDRWVERIVENREDNEDFCRAVEEDCLTTIQKKHKILADDDKEPKAKKGTKKNGNSDFADVDAGKENDFGFW